MIGVFVKMYVNIEYVHFFLNRNFDMEGKGKGEVSGQTFKVIESLKKMLLHEESWLVEQ